MRALRLYIDLLRPRPVRMVFLASLAGRLPSGMMSVALLLVLESRTHSYAVAGLAVGSYNVAFSLIAPVVGRLADRVGARRMLIVGAVAQLTAIAGLLWVVGLSSVPWHLVLCAAALGASFPPPITASMRALWPRLVSPARQADAYSLEAASTELVFIAGPLIVAALTALVSPALALAAAGVAISVGAIGMALAQPSREQAPQCVARHWAGPLARPEFRVLVPITFGTAGALGLLEVGVVAQATAAGKPALAGILLGVVACGSLAGGLWYGGRSWSSGEGRRYGWLLAAFAACLAPLIFAAGGGVAAFAACAIAGLMIAPVGSVQGQLVAMLAPSDTRTEAFTWINTGNFAGFSLGIASAGALVEAGGSPWAFAAAALAAAASALLAARVRDAAPGTSMAPA